MNLRLLAFLLLVPLILGACGSTPPEPASSTDTPPDDPLPEGNGTRESPYVGRGTVEEIGENELLIQHGTIPGWMPPMTMAFPVTDEVDLDSLAVGDEVTFNVELAGDNGYRVFRIE